MLFMTLSLLQEESASLTALLFTLIFVSVALRLYIQRAQTRRLAEFLGSREGDSNSPWAMTQTMQRNQEMQGLMFREFNSNDYEMLLQLDENSSRNLGLSQSQIERLPEHTIPAPSQVSIPIEETGDSEDDSGLPVCSICLEAKKPGQSVRTVPCLHQFHTECLDPWLRTKASCPECAMAVAV
mmetsp:Transcript_8818/g.16860  ORF Transcript_8818/g.16860 Transcript_8818/m.16860 type:complete len:183 (+) Transcript_8818:1-549(+)